MCAKSSILSAWEGAALPLPAQGRPSTIPHGPCRSRPVVSRYCNPYAERFVKTIKYECLNNFVIFGERHLRHLIKEFIEHYMTERFHQGIGGELIRNVGPMNDNRADGEVACRSRLGGMLNYYYREAA
jgi:hypothetical protein